MLFKLLSLCFIFVSSLTLAAAKVQTQPLDVDGKIFRFLAVDAKRVSLHWKGADGKPYRNFSALRTHFLANNERVSAMMNAGIYTKNYQPAGLYVENGTLLHQLNTKQGKGNFHLQPNGVFLITHKGQADILTTQSYQKYYQGREKQLKMAIQSGPMLLIDGKINPKFIPNSQSMYSRNGVCTNKEGALFFFATNNFPAVSSNFYQFAYAARKNGCHNALYLDGNISKLYVEGEDMLYFHFPQYVGILAVTEPKGTTK